MNLTELYRYKSRIMKDLCSNERIVKLVTGNDEAAVPNHDLPLTQIIPNRFVPETINDGKTFICYDIEVKAAADLNKTFYVPVLQLFVFTHKSQFYLKDGGILVDELTAEIDKMLNGNRFYGLGTLKLDSDSVFYPTRDYYGRDLTYYAAEFNRPKGKDGRPVNRQTSW